MLEVPDKVRETFERLKKEEDRYIELRKVHNSYVVRHATSVWDKEKKKPKKITEHMGVIKKDGTYVPKIPQNGIRGTSREIFEYANGELAYHFAKDVKQILEEEELTRFAKEIVATAIVKAIDPQPIRLLKSRWEKLYLSQELRVSLAPKHISEVLSEIGAQITTWYDLFSRLTTKDDVLLYDLSHIFTYSENIKIAEKGWNSHHEYLAQIGVILAFSAVQDLPIGIEVFPGSMRDITTIKDFRVRYPNVDIGYIFDRGFSSYQLLDELRDVNSHYIVPLKKNSQYMDSRWVRWKEPFAYRSRYLRWGRKNTDLGIVYFYEDPKIRGEQETTLLKRVMKGTITNDEYEEKRKVAGIVGLISDLDKDGPRIYDLYKGREDVELAFDALNNHIDSDKTYLRTEESVRGYYFVSFVALRIYFSILRRLRELGLTNKVSVAEVLFELSKVMKIKDKRGNESFAKVPKRAREVMEYFPNCFESSG